MKKKRLAGRGHVSAGFFAFILIGMFVVLALFQVLTGVNAYRHMYERTAINNEVRASMGYVMNKIRTCEGEITLMDENGASGLCLWENYGQEKYVTRIYAYEGTLYELFTGADDAFVPGEGDALTNVEAFDIQNEGKMVLISCRLNGDEEYSAHVNLPGGDGA